jgi:Uma2 family endonuclease
VDSGSGDPRAAYREHMVAVAREPELLPRPLTREQFDVLVGAGAYDDQRVELIEGVVVDMAPQGPEHGFWIGRLTTELAVRLAGAFGRAYEVRPQVPLAATGHSEPEPDLYVIDRTDSRPDVHPSRAHLVVEVAQSSRRTDLGIKARIYAAAAVPRYWVVDLADRVVVVHTDPVPGDGTAVTAMYGTVRRLPLDTDLEVLGLTVRLSDLLAA